MDPDLIPASKDDEPILADLLELYSHELRDIANLTPGADGRFGYPPLPLYWTDPDREPFLFRVGGELAGFVLVRKGSVVTGAADVWDVAEFFVLRPYRRQGAGGRAAHKVWRGHPGRWEVRVLERNGAALRFWQRTVDAFVGSHVEPEFHELAGKRWFVFAFVSARENPGALPAPRGETCLEARMKRERWIDLALWVPALFLVYVFARQGAAKFSDTSGWARAFRVWHFPDGFRVLIGVLEVSAALLLLTRRTAAIGATIIAVVMLGAMATHVYWGHPSQVTSEILPLALALLVVWGRRRHVAPLLSQVWRR